MADSDNEDCYADEEDWIDKRRRIASQQAHIVAAATAIICNDDSQVSTDVDNFLAQPSGGSIPRNRDANAKMFVRDENGNVVAMTATMSPWYLTYIVHPRPDDPKFLNKFRLRFRLPFAAFLQHLSVVNDDTHLPFFARWREGAGETFQQEIADKSPIELLVLGALRYLGRGWTFDDLEECTGICGEVHRCFFHRYIEFGSTILFKMYVAIPQTASDARSSDYENAGMMGCMGSMDATNIVGERICNDMKQEHTGFKQSSTARTYNIAVTNRHRILSTTNGHPARWNDKTLVRYDELATTLRYGKSVELDNLQFTLKERGQDGRINNVRYKGAWLLVDNGYLDWSCTIPPMKTTPSLAELRFSEWVESLRKDVECTFGILKGRFRILKSGVRLHGIEAIDRVWMTCCALHNMLLEYDGLDESEEWRTPLGDFDDDDIETAVPFAVQRLMDPGAIRGYDTSNMGRGDDRISDEEMAEADLDSDDECNHMTDEEQLDNARDESGVISVRLLSMRLFRQKLIENFELMAQSNAIQWPSFN